MEPLRMWVTMGPEMSLSLPDLPPGVKVAKYKVHACDWARWEATMDTYTRFLSVPMMCCMVHWCSSALLCIWVSSTVSEYPCDHSLSLHETIFGWREQVFRTRLTDVLMMIALFVVGSVQESIIAETDRWKISMREGFSIDGFSVTHWASWVR